MKKTSSKVVFFGNERLATGVSTTAPTLRRLINTGYDIVAVVSNYEAGTSRQSRKLEIQKVTDDNNIPLLLPKNPRDIIETLKAYQADIGVLVAYGKIVPQSIIDIFPKGIINLHPSLLPLHRGPTPIESVIINGDDKTGVSIMQLVKEMDSGPVFAQKEIMLTGQETKQELTNSLVEIGSNMIIEELPGIISGAITPKPQDDAKASYDGLISKKHGVLDLSKTAVQLEREIRAYASWPQSHTRLIDIDVVITKAYCFPGNGVPGSIEIDKKKNKILIYCGKGHLSVDRLKPIGKSDIDVASFIRGYSSRLGLVTK